MDSVVKDIENIIVGVIELIIIDNINKALKGATVTVQHTHSYCFERDQKDVADTRLMKRYLIFGLTRSLVLASIIGIIVLTYFNSKAYLEKQYYKIYTSTYLTKEERKAIMRDSHTLAILPDEFDKDPKRVKEIIKKNNKSLLF